MPWKGKDPDRRLRLSARRCRGWRARLRPKLRRCVPGCGLLDTSAKTSRPLIAVIRHHHLNSSDVVSKKIEIHQLIGIFYTSYIALYGDPLSLNAGENVKKAAKCESDTLTHGHVDMTTLWVPFFAISLSPKNNAIKLNFMKTYTYFSRYLIPIYPLKYSTGFL